MTTSTMKRLAAVDQGMISDCMIRLGLDGWMDGLHAVGNAAFAGPARTVLLAPRRGIEALPMSKYAVVAGLEKGDVLVTRATSAYFNVVLPLLGAIVTDRGGQLSHAAIVAREYGIPGIVGTKEATTTIPDGARVRVDGEKGEVTILAAATTALAPEVRA